MGATCTVEGEAATWTGTAAFPAVAEMAATAIVGVAATWAGAAGPAVCATVSAAEGWSEVAGAGEDWGDGDGAASS